MPTIEEQMSLDEVAVHEAAHFVVADHYGIVPTLVGIQADGGLCILPKPDTTDPVRVMLVAVATAAGPIAGARYAGRPDPTALDAEGCEQDRDSVAHCLSLIRGLLPENEVIPDPCQMAARVLDDPGNMASEVGLARQLKESFGCSLTPDRAVEGMGLRYDFAKVDEIRRYGWRHLV